MRAGLQSEASARTARGVVQQAMRSTSRVAPAYSATLKKRPPRGGAVRALAAVDGQVLRFSCLAWTGRSEGTA